MTSIPAEDTDVYDVVLSRPDDNCVLLLPDAQGWRLPRFIIERPPGDFRWRYASAAGNAALQSQTGFEAFTLRLLAWHEDGEQKPFAERVNGVLAMEAQNADMVATADSTGERWAGVYEAATLPYADPKQRDSLLVWFTQQQDAAFTARLRPWMRGDWSASIVEWIDERLQQAGRTRNGPVEQVRTWFISCVLRVPTTGGDVWFKACPPHNRYEPPLTEAFADVYPALLPTVFGADAERRWLLTQGIDGVRLNQHPDTALYLPRWEELLRQMARLQREWETRHDALLAWGCPDWRPATLATQSETLLNEIVRWLRESGDETPLPDPSDLAARVANLCARLNAGGINASFVHWDFHSGNLLANDSICKAIDWTGGLAHPFTLLFVVYEEHGDEAIRAHLRDVYLEAWGDVAPLEMLRDMVTDALTLAALQNVLGHFASLQGATMLWEQEADKPNLLAYLRHLARTLPEG